MARKLRYSKKLLNKVCKYIQEGASNKDAARVVGVCESTFYKWLSNDIDNPLSESQKAEFLESMERARAKRGYKLASLIIKASEINWRAAAWYLEKTEPQDYGFRSYEHCKSFLPREEEEKAEASPLLVEAYTQAVTMLATGGVPHFNAFNLYLNDALPATVNVCTKLI